MADKIAYHAKDLLEKKKNFVIARVVDTQGSTPRKKGAAMIMTEDGMTIGTIGGGKIEAVTQEYCRKTFETKERSKIHHFKLNTTDKDALDMGCGGDADVLIEYIDASKPESFTADFATKTTAYIFGGGHVARAIEPLLRYVDFETVVLDDRAEYANRERFPEAKDVIVLDSFEKSFDNITTDENSYIIIVTRGHMGDYDVLKDALKQECAYLGMIGSRKKNQLLYDKLRKEEGTTDEQIAEIYSPIGLPIKAETPEEIAVSVVAEIINVRAESQN